MTLARLVPPLIVVSWWRRPCYWTVLYKKRGFAHRGPSVGMQGGCHQATTLKHAQHCTCMHILGTVNVKLLYIYKRLLCSYLIIGYYSSALYFFDNLAIETNYTRTRSPRARARAITICFSCNPLLVAELSPAEPSLSDHILHQTQPSGARAARNGRHSTGRQRRQSRAHLR